MLLKTLGIYVPDHNTRNILQLMFLEDKNNIFYQLWENSDIILETSLKMQNYGSCIM